MNDKTTERTDEQSPAEDEPFETVWQGYDAAEGQMIEELLRQEGFTSRLIGTRTAALIGLGQFTAELRVEVPADSAEEACNVLKEFLEKAPDETQSESDSED